MTSPPEFEFPLFTPEVMSDPYPYYNQMHETGPILRNPALLGAWMVAGYDDVLRVLSGHQEFSSAAIGEDRDRIGAFEAPTMLNSDPPDHERLRGVVSRAFTPRAVAALEPRLREITDGLLETLRDGESWDVVGGLSSPLPVMAISELLGVSGDDRDSFRAWSNQLIAGSSEMASEEAVDQARAGAESLKAYFREEIRRRRFARGGGTDLVSRLVEANEGSVLDDAELLSACVLLLVAGNETTTNLITNAVLALGRHPDQRKLLADAPDLSASALQEVMRFDSPVQATVRAAAVPTVVGGHHIGGGEPVFVLIGAANRDPARFEKPNQLDLARDPNQHLGFGHGIHFCLGSGLARLEARVALEGLLAAAPDYGFVSDLARLDYGASFIFHSPKRLEVSAV